MATRSTIAYETPEGVRAIYCHWDGYPDEEGGVGQILNDHYNKLPDIIDLLNNGDLSALKPTLIESTFYQDRGEDSLASVYPTEASWIEWAMNCGCEYGYLYRGDKWNVQEI